MAEFNPFSPELRTNPYPIYSPTGHILYVDGARASTAIWALPFSLGGLQATGKPLTASEQAEFADFVANYKTNPALTELNNANANEPFVNVKVPKGATANPSIFEIRIQHK